MPLKDVTPLTPAEQAPNLLDRQERCIRVKHDSVRTGPAYVYRARRYSRFHGLRQPMDTGPAAIQAVLPYLANERQASASPDRHPGKHVCCGVIWMKRRKNSPRALRRRANHEAKGKETLLWQTLVAGISSNRCRLRCVGLGRNHVT